MTSGPSKVIYPVFNVNFSTEKFNLRPLPPVKPVKPDDKMCFGRIGCSGRVGIFLVLGMILIVLGLVSLGLYMNIAGMTTSKEHTELMPLHIPCGLVIFSGLVVSFQFWKRFKVLVLVSIGLNTATGFLCIIVGVVTITHVIKPLRNMKSCRYYTSQSLCQCFSPYNRDVFTLDFSDKDLTKYAFESAASCEDIEHTLPNLLYAISVVFCVDFVLVFVATTLALLVLRAERLKRGFLGEDSYEEVYTVSGSSQDQSDSESEVKNEVVTSPQGQLSVSKNSTSLSLGNTRESTPVSYSSINRSNVGSINRSNVSSINRTSAIGQRAVTPQLLTNKIQASVVQGQRLKTPGFNDLDLGKESLANRYRISKTPDYELNVRQRLSKTPDREIGSQRRYSFTASKRLSKSCDSLESSGNEAQEGTKSLGPEGKKKGKLKDHRRKGKRAATVHTLDTDQLLLILNLQMRYLQESKEQQQYNSASFDRSTGISTGSRRAVTPQPVSQKAIIQQKIRSHTPQPRRAAERLRAEAYAQNSHAINNSRHHQQLGQGKSVLESENCSRRTSESSERNSDLLSGNVNGDGEFQYYQGVRSGSLGNYADSYLHSQQIKSATQNSQNSQNSLKNAYQPYIFSADIPITGDQHFLTYSDSMLINLPSKPKSRPSVQNVFLPAKPLQRSAHQQLPANPVSRRNEMSTQLPQQPIHRGSSAFKVVDRKVPSRSPSAGSDPSGQLETSSRRTYGKVGEEIRDPVRENFSFNSKQTLKAADVEDDSVEVPRGFQDGERMNENFILRDRNYRPPEEALPPYSGPPSYKDHVSSCNTSVNSSLSSNPDDVYSFPKRQMHRNSDNPKNIVKNSSEKCSSSDQVNVGSADAGNSSGRLFKFTGAAVTDMNHLDRGVPNSGSENEVKGHGSVFKVKGHRKQQGLSSVESSPGRNRVKQIIVPEDYYTNISNVQRLTASSVKNKTPIREQEYGNIKSGKLQGYNYPGNKTDPGQIGPDDKYHEYEDVYETVSKDDENESGFEIGILKSSDKKSKNKTYMSRDVSNVHGISGTSLSNYKMAADVVIATDQGSVRNVHAEMKKSVPKIQLNSLSVDSTIVDEDDDDDVFIDSREKRIGSKPSRIHAGVTSSNSYEEINDLELANDISDPNHVADELANQELDSGYMKMTLPSKVIPLSNSERYGIAVHLTSPSCVNTPYHVTDLSANQNHFAGHMTHNQTNQNPSEGASNISTNNGNSVHVTRTSANHSGPVGHVTGISTNQNAGQRAEPDNSDSSSVEQFEETGV